MGYGISPIATDLAKVKKAIGSKDRQLLAKLRKACRDQFENIDDIDADEFEEDDEEEEGPGEKRIDTRTAMGQLINGEKLSPRFGFRYAYCLEMICTYYGEMMVNDKFCPMHMEWAERVDKSLKKAGVPAKVFSFLKVMYRGTPVKLPPPDDFPGVGYLTAREIVRVLPYFAKVKLDKVDADVRDAITQVRSWLETCARKKCDFITFYY